MIIICKPERICEAMRYSQIVHGIFLERPNRFLAKVEIKGQIHTSHVKNTGRCRELLVPGAEVLLEYYPDAKALGRKTEYSVTAVYKEREGYLSRVLINMDSQAPNQAAKEWIESGGFYTATGLSVEKLEREVTYGQSRFDLAFEAGGKPGFMEVKGVTLEEKGIAMFPDAPTERGVKHLQELMDAGKQGFFTYLLFVIQMKGVKSFRPNWDTHPAFAKTLKEASDSGLKVLAYDCIVREDGFALHEKVPVNYE